MPDDSRKVAAAAFKGELGKLGYELAQCGSATPVERLPEFNESTGYWDKPTAVTAKPTRWLFWLRRHNGVLSAEVPDAQGSRRLAFYTALLQSLATGARSGQSGQIARDPTARSNCSRTSWTTSARAEAPSPNARSTIPASPRMSFVMLKAGACPLRSARITSKPLIVA